ncbi:hypothetical protein TNCV_2740891 [Trichonephila clavipes]|nr:hypothetical protein TNCV_2740891 [Trichonephila clavipes]
MAQDIRTGVREILTSTSQLVQRSCSQAHPHAKSNNSRPFQTNVNAEHHLKGCQNHKTLSNYMWKRVTQQDESLFIRITGKQLNLIIDEEPLENACHVWSSIILLKYGWGQALKVRKDNWLQDLGDVALAV